jgi:hypothetical protein
MDEWCCRLEDNGNTPVLLLENNWIDFTSV